MISRETTEDRFKRVAEARTQAVLDKLRLLGNCANKRVYKYSDQDVDKIFNTITNRVKETRAQFTSPSKIKDTSFKL